jgi:hypothetical protein
MSKRPPAPAELPKRRKANRASSYSPENTDERYRLVIEAVAEGIYEWTITPNHLELSTRLTEILGFKTAVGRECPSLAYPARKCLSGSSDAH